jgi:hypothetical protein
MKLFIKDNWYKLMTGTSMLITAIAFLIFSTKHATANVNHISESTVSNGYPEGEWVYFITNGGFYRVKKGNFAKAFTTDWLFLAKDIFQYKKID